MALKAYRFPGLNKDVWLPDDIEVVMMPVPDSLIGWVRSGVTTNVVDGGYSTYHDTGTPGSNALTQARYLLSGPKNGDGSKRKVGFNFAVDDKRIVYLTPLNEVTWAAGTGTGNARSWHVEQCFGGSIDFDQAVRNAESLHAGLIHAIGDPVETTLVKHQYWYGKWCPGQVLNKGLWPTVVKNVSAKVESIKAHVAGGSPQPNPDPAPTYASPSPIPQLDAASKDANTAPAIVAVGKTRWVAVFDRVRVIRETPRLQYGNKDSKFVGPLLKVGEEFDVNYIGWEEGGDPVYYTPFATRVWAADTERKNDARATQPNAEGADES